MKITYCIDETVCFLQFMHHLSGWHYSAQKRGFEAYRNSPFPQTTEELQAMQQWTTYSKKLFKHESVFLAEKYILKTLLPREHKLIAECREAFHDRFQQIYKTQHANMLSLKTFLESQRFDVTLKLLKKVYGNFSTYTKVYVCLSQNANKHAGGMVLADTVLLDFGDWKLDRKGNTPLLHTLVHELAHDASLSRYLPKDVSLSTPKGFTGNTQDFFDECIHHALLSEKGLATNPLSTKMPNFKVRGSKEPYISIENTCNVIAPVLQKALHSRTSNPKKLAHELLQTLTKKN